MVASPPLHDDLITRLLRLEDRLDEVSRSNKYPFSVAPGGNVFFRIAPDAHAKTANGQAVANIEIGYGDGNPLLQTAPNHTKGDNGEQKFPGRQQFQMLDPAGNTLFQSDPDIGYGLSAPRFPGQVYPISQISTQVADSATEVSPWLGQYFALNPAVQLKYRIEVQPYTGSSGTVTGEGWVSVTGADGTVWTLPPTTVTGNDTRVVSSTEVTQNIGLRAHDINTLLQITYTVRVTAGNGSCAISPYYVLGIPYAMYQADPAM